MKRIWLFFFLCIFVPSVGSAATVNLDVRLDFDATKTVHDCFALAGGGGFPNPGPGNCGIYQNINFGETMPSYLSFAGAWDTVTGFLLPTSISCYFGSERCILGSGRPPQLSFDGLSSLTLLTGNDIYSFFNFNLLTGTGQHLWEDDNGPYFGKGAIDLTNVRAVIATEVPLPASLMLLPLGLLALVTVGRLEKRRQ